MNSVSYLSIQFCLLLSCACISCAGPSTNPERNRSSNLKDVTHTAWAPATNKVHRSGANAPVAINSRKATYQYEVGHHGTSSVSVVTFFSAQNRHVWIGPEQDFYLEDDTGIIGGRLTAGGLIIWCESLHKGPLGNAELDDVIKGFEEDVDLAGLRATLTGGHDDATRMEHLTNLNKLFKPWAFTDGPYSSTSSTKTRIVSTEMVNGLFKLQLENTASNFRGEAWINPKTKQVTKSVQDGEQVFPK